MVDPFAPPLADPTPHLAQLRDALNRLAGSALPGSARVALVEAQLALAALESLNSGTVDQTVFDALLEMAGPEVAPELVAQMAADLRAVETALKQSLSVLDWEDIRAQTHVLVALAGSAGARGLELAAKAMNHAAHDGDTAHMRENGPGVLADLGRLIRFVDDALPGKAGAR